MQSMAGGAMLLSWKGTSNIHLLVESGLQAERSGRSSREVTRPHQVWRPGYPRSWQGRLQCPNLGLPETANGHAIPRFPTAVPTNMLS